MAPLWADQKEPSLVDLRAGQMAAQKAYRKAHQRVDQRAPRKAD